MKKIPKNFKLSNDIYHVDIYVFAGHTYEQAQKLWYKRIKHQGPVNKDDGRKAASVFVYEYNRKPMVWFRDVKPSAATMAHEGLHLVHYILSTLGLNLTDESEEAYTYLLEWFIRQLEKSLR